MAGQGISGDHKDESIDSDDYVDGSVDTIHLADNAVTLAKMASGTLGAMTHTKPTGSGDIVRAVGYAATADVVFFQPSSDFLVLA